MVRAPLEHVGVWGQFLGKLVAARIPVTSSIIIPQETLEAIADANQLATKLEQAPDEAKQRHLFTNQFIPPEIARDLLKAIHTELLDQKITLTASWLVKGENQNLSLTTQGDANCLESMLDLWARAYFAQTNSSTRRLVPVAIVLQITLGSEVSGFSLTRSEDESKQTIVLHLDQDSSITQAVDIRTWHLVQTAPGSPFMKVPVQTWLALAQYLQAIRLWSLHNYRVTWQVYQHQALITGISLVADQTHQLPRLRRPLIQGTIQGQTVIPGKVVGPVVTTPQLLTTHGVLVVSKLEALSPRTAAMLSAVVVEHHLGPSVVSILQKYHIPTIIRAANATSRFKIGQSVLVDASNGVVSVASSPQLKTRSAKTSSIYVSANQSLSQEPYPTYEPQGILFRPELTLTSTGNHPIHMIRSHHRGELFSLLTSTIASYRQLDVPLLYRLTAFTTDQLRSLGHGVMYEPLEPNPRLGFYGGLRSVSNPELLDFELSALTRIAPTFRQPLGVVLSGCRSSGELKALLHHAQSYFSAKQSRKLWWELDTPEQIYNAAEYVDPAIDGVIINAQSLHALSHGIDPTNPDVYHRYTWHENLISEWVRHLQAQVTGKPIFLYVTEDQPAVFRVVKELGLSGLIVKPAHAQVASSYLEHYVSH